MSHTLLLLSKDFGELVLATRFALGMDTPVTVAAPAAHLGAGARDQPLPLVEWRGAVDARRLVAKLDPKLILLCCGYLYGLHGQLEDDELAALLNEWRAAGRTVVTTDPFLGMASQLGSGDVAGREVDRDWLLAHLPVLAGMLARAPHLYPMPVRIDQAPATLSFCNPGPLLDPAEARRRTAALSRASGMSADVDSWLFLLNPIDYHLLAYQAGGAAVFARQLAERLGDAARAGRLPVLVAPTECLAELPAMPFPAVARTALGHADFLALMARAEYVFYWNLYSASTVLRAQFERPFFCFGLGHLAHYLPAFAHHAAAAYYPGLDTDLLMCPPGELEADDLARRATRQRSKVLAPTAQRLRSAATPEQLVAALLR